MYPALVKKITIAGSLLLAACIVTFIILSVYFKYTSFSIRVEGAQNGEVAAELDNFLKDNNVVNAAVALGTYKNGEIAEYYFGVSSYPWGKRADGNTMYEIGSITKTFTAALTQEEVLGNLLQIDAPANSYLPDGKKLPSYHSREITIRDLLTHTSQLPRDTPDYFNPGHSENPCKYVTPESIYGFLKRYELKSEPGSSYSYSNIEFAILGNILESSSGQSYNYILNREIFNRLGMKHSTLVLDERAKSEMAEGYDVNGKTVGKTGISVPIFRQEACIRTCRI